MTDVDKLSVLDTNTKEKSEILVMNYKNTIGYITRREIFPLADLIRSMHDDIKYMLENQDNMIKFSDMGYILVRIEGSGLEFWVDPSLDGDWNSN